MTVLRTTVVAAMAAITALTTMVLLAPLFIPAKEDEDTFYSSLVGGPFKLRTHTGAAISNEDLLGQPFAVFFGFTQCPDVCPTSMLQLSYLIEDLGADADRMRFLFVSVDPERDTADLLEEYLSNFDRRLTGLVGTPEEIASIAKAYRVYYEQVPTSGGYTINHTTTIYLMDAKGRLASTIAFGEEHETALKKLRRLVAKGTG